MLLNCTRVKHVRTALQICQITRTVQRNPLLLLRRPFNQLCKIRTPPAPAVARSTGGSTKWVTYLLNFRRGFRTGHKPGEEVGNFFKSFKSEYKRLLTLTTDEIGTLLIGFICLVVSSAITMSVPFFLGRVVDVVFNKKGLEAKALENLRGYSLQLLGLFLIGGLANLARVYLFGAASLRIVRRLRSKLYRAILSQEVGWFDTRGTGELVNRLSNDTYVVGTALSYNLSDGLRSTAMIGVGSVMMAVTSPELALVSALVVPALGGMAIVYGRYVRRITKLELDEYADLMKHAEERFGNVRTVKSFCHELKEFDQYDKKLDAAKLIGYKEAKAKSIFFGMTGFSGNFVMISVLYYGGTLVLDNQLTIGAMTAFMMYAGYVGVAMNGVSNFYSHLNKGIGASTRIWEIIDRKYAIPINTGISPKAKPVGEMRFDNVDFSYPSRPDINVLSKFSLTLQPHQTTAIVGRSGSGKSTMALLLLRLYDPLQGKVYLDGTDLSTINPLWLRHHVAAVPQDPVLFSGSIRSNILYGLNPDDPPDENRLQRVVRDSNVLEFIKNLPFGLETIVGQRGILLSGGQKQRVAIARALIKNPTVLVLDEATSALDSVSEQLVQTALDRLIKGRTVMTIAHRLSTIHKAHKIAVLQHGAIVEAGTYDELMQIPDGKFRELVSKQAFAV
ncbi:ATP-binding cassette sub-family B member 10, mitochondrial [Drosophila grimshawi]|uniref:GH24416 n=1 Tax=Drosophila grimshawi TaxID=7222 RepID=B4JM09_DROGR|nr:ATP-binding cassette sub-family B member 10, mitochondrial [Drosophila grimshawi]EDV91770.1 GH24416 [Drosophila grimshawi]